MPASTAAPPRTGVRALLRNLAAEDRIALAFHSYLLVRVGLAPPSAGRDVAIVLGCALLGVTLSAVLLTRSEAIGPGRLRTFVYRFGIFAPIPVSYAQLRSLLPALQPELLDLQLLALDQALLGTTPAMWLNRFNTVPVVEWVSFFYWSYFPLMAAMFLPALLFGRGRRLRELMLGSMIVGVCGHAGYTLVPGAGPFATLAFPEPLHGGFFWEQVQRTVASGGAMLDIFPSLHTAFPTLFALHAFAWRRTRLHRWTWPLVAFFAANMVFATMFLRWHWFVDVLAGLCLAFMARRIAVWLTRREAARRDRGCTRMLAWEPIRR